MPRTIYISKEVDVEVEMDDFLDEELIEELERRGYFISDKKRTSDIDYLYSTWLTCSKETFEKELKEFFNSYITK